MSFDPARSAGLGIIENALDRISGPHGDFDHGFGSIETRMREDPRERDADLTNVMHRL